MKKILAMLLCALLALGCVAALAEGELVGVSMPTKDLQRWNQDGAYMEQLLKDAGYEPDLQFANNNSADQLSQIMTMIDNGAQVVVIAEIFFSSSREFPRIARFRGFSGRRKTAAPAAGNCSSSF